MTFAKKTAALAAGLAGLGSLGAGVPLRDRIINVTTRTAMGQFEPPRGDLECVRHQFYHRLDVAALTSQLEFFGVGPQQHVCNMIAGANGLPNNYGFVCTHIGLNITSGYAVSGSAVAAVDPYNTSTVPLQAAADHKQMLDHGLFRLSINDREVCQVFGLGRLAAGSRADIQANAYGTAAAISLAQVRTGTPHDDNGFECRPWLIVRESQSVRATVDWNIARTLQGAYVVTLTLDGILIRPR